MNPEQLNLNPKSEKEILWEQKLSEVNEIADSLGKGVDEKIKKTVAIFLAHEFTTSGSCEGHTIKDGETEYGLPFPWVEVYAPEPGGKKVKKNNKSGWLKI